MVRVCTIRDIECTRGCTNVCQREFDELKEKAYAAGVAAGKERERCNALSSKLDEALKKNRDFEDDWYSPAHVARLNENITALESRLDTAEKERDQWENRFAEWSEEANREHAALKLEIERLEAQHSQGNAEYSKLESRLEERTKERDELFKSLAELEAERIEYVRGGPIERRDGMIVENCVFHKEGCKVNPCTCGAAVERQEIK